MVRGGRERETIWEPGLGEYVNVGGKGTYTFCNSVDRMLSFMSFRLAMTHAGFALVSGMVSARTLPPR